MRKEIYSANDKIYEIIDLVNLWDEKQTNPINMMSKLATTLPKQSSVIRNVKWSNNKLFKYKKQRSRNKNSKHTESMEYDILIRPFNDREKKKGNMLLKQYNDYHDILKEGFDNSEIKIAKLPFGFGYGKNKKEEVSVSVKIKHFENNGVARKNGAKKG